ncbi:MAG: E3 binding domain-containing protein, partial [Caulobacteraceae bacterium]|nr:E3 binding domain-containing protein [Caulobacteraceae bacterium]
MSRFVFKLPDVGEGVAEAEIVAWHVEPGQFVAEDQPLVDVMTDKATVEMTAPVSGVLVSRQGAEGDLMPVGSELAVFELGEDAASAPEDVESSGEPDEPEAEEDLGARYLAATVPASTSLAPVEANKPLASPAVRERSDRLGIDLADVPGGGPEGRITHADLD